MVDLEVAIHGGLPARALQIALGVQMPICQLLVCKLVGELAQPSVDIKGFARGETNENDPRSFLAGKLRQSHGCAVHLSKALFAVHAHQLAAIVVGPGVIGAAKPRLMTFFLWQTFAPR